MLVQNNIIKKVDSIVDEAYLDLTFDLVGENFLTEDQQRQVESAGLIVGKRPLLELLYVLIRNRSEERLQFDAKLQNLLDEVQRTGILPILSDTDQATLDNVKAGVDNAIDQSKSKVKNRIKDEIIQINKQQKDLNTVAPTGSMAEQQERNSRFMGELFVAIGVVLAKAHSDFIREWTSELTDFINDSVVDQARMVAGGAKEARDTIVYKTVVNAKSLCEWCNKFYLEGGKPKEYKLADLLKNGTNDGKPKSQWRPVVGKTHPRCRCQLHIKSTQDRQD